MNRNVSIIFSAIFFLITFLTCQALAASITEKTAAIGEGCVASGENSTAMGVNTTASNYFSTAMGNGSKAIGFTSTAMGQYTEASGKYSTAMGFWNKAGGFASFAAGRNMHLTSTTECTFVWGNSDADQSITAANAFLIFPAGISGMVGIGTKSPSEKLDVVGHIKVEGDGGWNSTGDEANISLGSVTKQFYMSAVYGDGLKLGTYAAPDAFVLKQITGNVGIGTGTSPVNFKLAVNGTAAKPGGGTWSTYSDARLKDITGEYSRGLDAILGLKPVVFRYKEDNPRGLPTDEEYVGFVAQEVEEVFPEAVSEDSDGYLDFNMHPVNVALVNAVKELKAENDDIRAENDSLRAENSMLKKDIEKIKAILGI